MKNLWEWLKLYAKTEMRLSSIHWILQKKTLLLDYVIYKPFLGWVSSMKNNYIVM